jgi:hypothetical protein
MIVLDNPDDGKRHKSPLTLEQLLLRMRWGAYLDFLLSGPRVPKCTLRSWAAAIPEGNDPLTQIDDRRIAMRPSLLAVEVAISADEDHDQSALPCCQGCGAVNAPCGLDKLAIDPPGAGDDGCVSREAVDVFLDGAKVWILAATYDRYVLENHGRIPFMHPFVAGFANELAKIASEHHVSGADVALYEAFGPLASAAKGYKRGGVKGAVKGGLAGVAGGGLGAGLGLLAAHGLKKLTGHDVGAGSVRASTVLPAAGALIGSLKADKMLGHHHGS